MNEEHLESNKVTSLRAWRIGGPMTPTQRKEAKRLFIEAFKKTATVTYACDYAGIAPKTAYDWREKDKQFGKEWEDAINRIKDVARVSIYQRAFLGWEEPAISLKQVVYNYTPILDEDGNQKFDAQGRPLMNRADVVMIRKYSDPLAIAWAKANLPEFKEEKAEINIHNEISAMAVNAKNDLLRDLASAVEEKSDEGQKETHQE